MRVQQLWNWIYVRGVTRFDDMTSVSKDLRAALEEHFTLERPEVVAEQVSVDGTRKWLLRLPGEHAGERPHEVECVYIPDTGRATLVRLEPGRLHAHLLVLPHRHAAPGAQPHAGRDRRAGDGRARSSRRLAGRRAARRRDRADGRRPLRHQHRHDGHGRAALQFRRGARRAAGRGRTATASASPSAASRSRPPAWCRTSRAPATRSAPCWRSRCTPCATTCATSWCRSIANIRSPNCSTPAATIRASRMRGASRSST